MVNEEKKEKYGEAACQISKEEPTIPCPFCGEDMIYIYSRFPYFRCGHCQYDISFGYTEEYRKMVATWRFIKSIKDDEEE